MITVCKETSCKKRKVLVSDQLTKYWCVGSDLWQKKGLRKHLGHCSRDYQWMGPVPAAGMRTRGLSICMAWDMFLIDSWFWVLELKCGCVSVVKIGLMAETRARNPTESRWGSAIPSAHHRDREGLGADARLYCRLCLPSFFSLFLLFSLLRGVRSSSWLGLGVPPAKNSSFFPSKWCEMFQKKD